MDVRRGRLTDLPALTDIYNGYVIGTAATFDTEPYAVDARRAWFDGYAATGPYRLLIADSGDEVVGYATSSRFRDRAAYASSVETTVYLRPGETGRGTGSLLYAALLDALVAEGLHRAYAAIALPNDASIALHRRFGFADVGTLHEVGYKLGRWCDVHWMERRF